MSIEKETEKTEKEITTAKKASKKSEKKVKAPRRSVGWKTPLEFPYAVVRTGGKQYCLSKGDQVLVEKLGIDPGADWTAEEVLFVAEGPGKFHLGKPTVKGAKVKFEVLQQTLGPKILIRHSRRRQSSQKTLGHRQPQTRLLVKEISA